MNGNIPPQSIISEEFILSRFINDNETLSFYIREISDKSFYHHEYSLLYKTIADMYNKNISVDAMSLDVELKKNNLSDKIPTTLIFDLMDKTASSANIEYHINEVREKEKLRDFISSFNEVSNEAFNADVTLAGLLEKAQEKLDGIAKDNSEKTESLPGFESAKKGRRNLKACLIDGVLRQGHKMIISGASKAGKSFSLINLAIAIAEGRKWMGFFPCTQGKVIYINIEIDNDSFVNRVHDVYDKLSIEKTNIDNLIIWNLRGKNVNISKIVTTLEKRLKKLEGIAAVILDPLYKVLEGDESDAAAMTQFGNKLDMIATQNNVAVIYCHHHSKGDQFFKKSMDRGSGSGVLIRDPDAIIDLIELEPPKVEFADVSPSYFKSYIMNLPSDVNSKDYLNDDVLESISLVEKYIHSHVSDPGGAIFRLRRMMNVRLVELNERTAWKIEANLREFKGFTDVNIWFDWPLHTYDVQGELMGCYPVGDPRNKKKIKAVGEVIKEPKTKKFKHFIKNIKIFYDQYKGDKNGLVSACMGNNTSENQRTFKEFIEQSEDYSFDNNGYVIKETINYNATW